MVQQDYAFMPLLYGRALLATLLTILTTSLSQAQVQGTTVSPAKGEIRLRVRDDSGLPVRAHATLRGPSPGSTRTLEVATDGSLTVLDLPFGTYHLELVQSGFAPQTITFQLQTAQPVSSDVILTVAGLSTTVNVIASTPIGALDLAVADVPVPVQSLTAQTLEDTNAVDLSDALKKRLIGVYVNENQNNPFQPDVNYRGYTASPLVGSSEGLSVYLDGVRQNQPFGDVVSWDLIPKVALKTVELIPGSNPVYGLNTLGGAIAVQTKDGLNDRGFSINGYGGSFGRRAVEAEYGGTTPLGLSWFVAGTLFREDGWRVQSRSNVRQSFAKLGYTRNRTIISLSGGYAINSLSGNGTQDFRAIQRTVGLIHGYNSIYSIPDTTDQHSPFLTLNASRFATNTLSFNANAYLRYIRTNTTNGDINNNSFTESLYTLSTAEKAALTSAGISFPTTPINPANTPFPYLRCIAQGLAFNEPFGKCNGVDTDTVDRQTAGGISGVITWHTQHNLLAAGVGLDHGSLTFVQKGQFGYLNPDGISITRINSYLDGSTNSNGILVDSRVNLHGTTNTPSIYASDTLNLGKWVFSVGARYNHVNVNNTDRLPLVSYRGTLTAVNVFPRFNPTAGVIYKPSSRLHISFNYGESSRAPTSSELGCADPNFPCSRPNALVSDPPLKQVVSRTIEFALRGNPHGHYRWTADYFHADNFDDLLYVAAQQTGYGNFMNFGKTRRQGVEAAFSTHVRHLETGVDYTFLSATYQSSQTLNAGSNSSNSNALSGEPGVTDGGTIIITPGNNIPQVPQHLLKLYTDFRLHKLSLDADFSLIGSSFVRGNENNLHRPDGLYYLGSGKSPGYGVINLGAHYKFNPHYEFFAQINNALNRHYYTVGQLASTPYDNAGNFIARPFPIIAATGDYAVRSTTYLSPGAPLTVFGGLKVSFGRQ